MSKGVFTRDRQCAECKKPFTYTITGQGRPRLYCSDVCYYRHHRERILSYQHKWYREVTVPRRAAEWAAAGKTANCLICGKPLSPPFVPRRRMYSCSEECRVRLRKDRTNAREREKRRAKREAINA